MNNSKKLSEIEQKHINQMISDTNPFRLSEVNQKIFNGIRNDFLRQTANGGLAFLTEKQITAIKASYRTSITVQEKLKTSSEIDIECKLNLYANPISR